ncbi:hypothetical protein STSP_03940 [Streptomyces jeddahensis]|uniref:Uncharacterized protein n=1 Tax=Streptomyces jeddahensis TaxID=1716141 RepID=A0A177HZG0_9ACTN|nr:hypothetical protein STSP_03940 [Streptomyces jeddahensis]
MTHLALRCTLFCISHPDHQENEHADSRTLPG